MLTRNDHWHSPPRKFTGAALSALNISPWTTIPLMWHLEAAHICICATLVRIPHKTPRKWINYRPFWVLVSSDQHMYSGRVAFQECNLSPSVKRSRWIISLSPSVKENRGLQKKPWRLINGIHNHGNHYKVADTEGAYGEYYGEWMNGMANGQGTVKYASGNVYSGALKV